MKNYEEYLKKDRDQRVIEFVNRFLKEAGKQPSDLPEILVEVEKDQKERERSRRRCIGIVAIISIAMIYIGAFFSVAFQPNVKDITFLVLWYMASIALIPIAYAAWSVYDDHRDAPLYKITNMINYIRQYIFIQSEQEKEKSSVWQKPLQREDNATITAIKKDLKYKPYHELIELVESCFKSEEEPLTNLPVRQAQLGIYCELLKSSMHKFVGIISIISIIMIIAGVFFSVNIQPTFESITFLLSWYTLAVILIPLAYVVWNVYNKHKDPQISLSHAENLLTAFEIYISLKSEKENEKE